MSRRKRAKKARGTRKARRHYRRNPETSTVVLAAAALAALGVAGYFLLRKDAEEKKLDPSEAMKWMPSAGALNTLTQSVAGASRNATKIASGYASFLKR